MKALLQKRVRAGILAIVIALALVGSAAAAPGDLDPTFGSGGKVTTAFPVAGYVVTPVTDFNYNNATAAAFQPDGKIVVAGNFYPVAWGYSKIGVIRYLSDGTLDTSFNSHGYMTTQLASAYYYGAFASAVGVLPDGRIVVVGRVVNKYIPETEVSHTNAVIVPLNADGSLDTSFNTTGYKIIEFADDEGMLYDENATAVAIQADGKIVVGITYSRYNANNFILARINLDGSLDATFGANGIVTTDFGAAYGEGIHALAMQTAGGVERILAVGTAPSNSGDFALARYSVSNGALDTTFGTNGKTTTDFGAADSARAVAVKSDGSLIVSGSTHNGATTDFALARYAANGALDTSFDTDGKQVTSITEENDVSTAVAFQSDGKILASGTTNEGDNIRMALTRYTASGALDTSFGASGVVSSGFSQSSDTAAAVLLQPAGRILVAGDLGSRGSSLDIFLMGLTGAGAFDNTFGLEYARTDAQAYALAVQPDGKTVVAGYANPVRSGFSRDFALARYNTDGSLDPSFSGDGRLSINFGDSDQEAFDVAIQPDGKILAAGLTDGSTPTYVVVVVRCNPDGTLDASFGTNGMVKNAFGMDNGIAQSLAIQPDGKILLAGYASDSSTDGAFLLARLTANGEPDASFGVNGVATTSFSDPVNINEIALQPDGKIVAVGSIIYLSEGFKPGVVLARYTAAGVLDTTFGSNGTLIPTWGDGDSADAVDLQPDGKIVAAGMASIGNDLHFAVARYNPDGSADSSFGTNGLAATNISVGKDDSIEDVIVLRDGKIVAVGASQDASDRRDFALAKYNRDGSLDTTFGNAGTLLINFGGAEVEGGSAIGALSDGTLIVAGATDIKQASGQNIYFALARIENELDLSLVYLPVIAR